MTTASSNHSTDEVLMILGASNNPDRYSNRLINLAHEKRFSVVAINPKGQIGDFPTYPSLGAWQESQKGSNQSPPKVTLSVYLNADNFLPLIDEVVAIKPYRIILNPGSDDPQVVATLQGLELPVLQACNLVMMTTGQY